MKLQRLPSLLFALLLIGYQYASYAKDIVPPHGLIPIENRPAPAFKLPDIDGAIYDSAASKKRWHFVHFWASWCAPCRKEMPAIQRMQNKIKDNQLEIVMINTAEDEDTVFSFLGAVAPDLNSLLDSDGEVTEQWQPRGLPSTYLVDPQQRIRFIAIGGRAWDQAEYLHFLKKLIMGK